MKGKSDRPRQIGSLQALLRNPELTREERIRYSLRLAELQGDAVKAAKLRALLG